LERIIITGGSGFIGRHLVEKILSKKLSSIALIANTSNFHKNQFENKKLFQDTRPKLYIADIRDTKAISDVFEHEKAETCIHLAAKISVADSISNPKETMDINVKGTQNVLDACSNNKVRNFVFASSAAVYGDVTELPISENQSLRPLSPYGTSKMLAEQHVLSYKQLKKIKNTISLRIFNVYGGGQASEADVITRFAKRLSIGQPPVIYGDGLQTRDFISVDDVVDAIILSTRAMEDVENKVTVLPSIFNVGTGTPTSISQLAQKMIEIFGLDLKPVYEHGKKDERGILHSYADITLAKKNLHFVAKKGIERGLRDIIEPIILRKNFH
jgi:UDP-glucose 4-epimerase